MAYNTSVSFDSVVAIQSLPSGELRTGEELFETTLAPVSVADAGFVSELRHAASGREFLAHLDAVANVAARFGRSPLLHIESHGGREGIRLGNGDLVRWDDIAPKLAAINRISRVNLLVCAAMCRGWHMSDILRPTDQTPAFGILGTTEDVRAGVLLGVMQAFYGTLLQDSHDLTLALKAANEAATPHGVSFEMVGAELLFCRVFRAYMESLQAEETQEERVNRLVADVARVRGLDVVQTMKLRRQIREELDDHEVWYDRYRTHFLMLDEFPENGRRFGYSFSDCVGGAS